MKIVSGNIAERDECWRSLLESDYDIAFLQEASEPPADVAEHVLSGQGPWLTESAQKRRPWRTAVVLLHKQFDAGWFETLAISVAGAEHLPVSVPGAVAAAHISTAQGELTVVSAYSLWESPLASVKGSWICADALAHRLISDLLVLIATQKSHRVIFAGDWSVLRGYGENGSVCGQKRYGSVFESARGNRTSVRRSGGAQRQTGKPLARELPLKPLCPDVPHQWNAPRRRPETDRLCLRISYRHAESTREKRAGRLGPE